MLRRTPRAQAADALIVGYPGQFDLPAARRAARGRPVVFNPLVSLADTLVADRGRFRPRLAAGPRCSPPSTDSSLRAADLVVADTRAHADRFAELAGLPAGADRDLLRRRGGADLPAGLGRPERFTCLLRREADPAARPGDDPRRRPGSRPSSRSGSSGAASSTRCSQNRPANVEHVPWVEYERLPDELHRAGCALGIFGRVGEGGAGDPEQGLPGARVRDAARDRGHAGVRASCWRTASARCSCRPATARRWRPRCAAWRPTPGSPTGCRSAGWPRTASTRARTCSAPAGEASSRSCSVRTSRRRIGTVRAQTRALVRGYRQRRGRRVRPHPS